MSKCTNHPDRHGAFALEGKQYCTECHAEILKTWNLQDSKKSFDPWESDCHSILGSLRLEATVENVDFIADESIRRIAVLKHIATELAAHGDCHCDKKNEAVDCIYCLACQITRLPGCAMQTEDENHLIDFQANQLLVVKR